MSTQHSEFHRRADFVLRQAQTYLRDAPQTMKDDAEGQRLAKRARDALDALRTHIASRTETKR